MASHKLGQSVDYPKAYSPKLLAAIPRQENRSALGINSEATLPFIGADVWNAFELSWLNSVGMPQVGRGRFVFPCSSPNLVESKSLKLYLNSLNQHRFSDRDAVIATITEDLSRVAGAEVQVVLQSFRGMQEVLEVPDGTCLDKLEITCDDYQLNSGLLQAKDNGDLFEALVEEVLYTDLFRSLCPVTGQPDWASIVICYHGAQFDHRNLLRYLLSFREHRDFHENCVERIYTDLQKAYKPDSLSIEANFTRRGGLDINPVRSSADSINYMLLPRYNRQ